MQRTFADGKNVGIARLQSIVDGDTAAITQLQSGLLRQVIARTNPGRYDQHVAFQRRAVCELDALNLAVAVNFL